MRRALLILLFPFNVTALNCGVQGAVYPIFVLSHQKIFNGFNVKNGYYRRETMKTIPVEQSGWNTNKGCYSSPIQEEDYVWVQMKLRDFKMLKQIKEKEIKKGKLKR